MRIEVVVPVIPSFLEPPKPSAAEKRQEERVKARQIKVWPDCPGGYSPKDWEDLQRRQGRVCAHCGRKKDLFRVRKTPPNRGGTNNIGNIIGLCETCKDYKHDKLYCELRYMTAKIDRMLERGDFKTKGRALPVRRYNRLKAKAVERGFMREPGVAYDATDSDACVCKKGQAPHLLGSEVCKNKTP